MAKSVKVHDDTHRALKRLKSRQRSRSLDEVIRNLIRTSTGAPVGSDVERKEALLSSFPRQ